MSRKLEHCGDLEIRGKVAVLSLGPREGPVVVFCFISDLERLLDGTFSYVKFFLCGDKDGARAT